MSLNELLSRARASGASAAFIVSLYKGNPGAIHVYYPSGVKAFRIRLESAVLRREVLPGKRPRVHSIRSVSVPLGSSKQTVRLARAMAQLLSLPLRDSIEPNPSGKDEAHMVDICISDYPSNKILWTYRLVPNGLEIGPRIRISEVRWFISNE